MGALIGPVDGYSPGADVDGDDVEVDDGDGDDVVDCV